MKWTRWCDSVRCIYMCLQCTVYSRVHGMLYNVHLIIEEFYSRSKPCVVVAEHSFYKGNIINTPCLPVLRIRIRSDPVFLGHLDPDPDFLKPDPRFQLRKRGPDPQHWFSRLHHGFPIEDHQKRGHVARFVRCSSCYLILLHGIENSVLPWFKTGDT